MGFDSINGFEMKLSGGCGAVLVSRDLWRFCARLDVFRLLHFYYRCEGCGGVMAEGSVGICGAFAHASTSSACFTFPTGVKCVGCGVQGLPTTRAPRCSNHTTLVAAAFRHPCSGLGHYLNSWLLMMTVRLIGFITCWKIGAID